MITENKQPMTPDDVIRYISDRGHYLSVLREQLESMKSKKPNSYYTSKYHKFWIYPALSHVGQPFIDVVHMLAVSMLEAKINEIDAELKMMIK